MSERAGLAARFSATWKGWSGRPYECAILCLAEAVPDADAQAVVSFPVARTAGIARPTAKPQFAPVTAGVIATARRGAASELHVYPLQGSDDPRLVVEDLRRAT